MTIASANVPVADLNRSFLDNFMSKDPSRVKAAEYAVNSYVRSKLREDGIVRSQILPAIGLQDGQLDRDKDPKVLKKFMEIEPDSTATYVPFRGMAESRLVEGEFVEVFFGKIQSELHTVNIVELKNYNNDLRKILNDQDVKNIQGQEDSSFINKVNSICAANPAEQEFELIGGFTKTNWVTARQKFPINIPIKHALMNTRMAKEFEKWNYLSDLGSSVYGGEMYVNGFAGKAHGLQVIQTIKDDLVPDGVVYFFAPEDFLGKFYTLLEPTTYIEQKMDWLQFQTYEIIGIGIGNTRSVIKCTFTNK